MPRTFPHNVTLGSFLLAFPDNADVALVNFYADW